MSCDIFLHVLKYNILIVLCSFVFAQDPIVNLQQGRIVGIKTYVKGSVPVEIYYGIPYASPPIGKLRFSAPSRHPGWRRTLLAHRQQPRCPQPGGEAEFFSEDCLFLDICTPRHSDGSSLPVVVLLHSESWSRGGPPLPCQELAAEGLVVVTVSYRLNLLAFFTLASSSARGNLALLDQYLSLLWVRENAGAFGGDSASVTLLGHSAGADDVLYHLASPRTLGLFHRAIIMSPRNVWHALDEQRVISAGKMAEISRDVARTLGCDQRSDLEMLACMRAKPMADIMILYSNASLTDFGPVADTFLPETDRYLPNSLAVALSASKQQVMQVDILLGTTDLESTDDNGKLYELSQRDQLQILDYAKTKAIPETLRMFPMYRADAVLSVVKQAVVWEYFGEEKRATSAYESLVRMLSASQHTVGAALVAARLARRASRLYVYRYSQPGVDLKGHTTNYTGAVHGSDLMALLGDALMLQIARRPASPEESRKSAIFRRYVSNFIKFGSPSSDEGWQRYREGEASSFDIHDKLAPIPARSSIRDVSFWLHYLPTLAGLISSPGRTEELSSGQEDQRLRGGVFALCGVSVVLLMLLFACLVILRRNRSRRSSIDIDNNINNASYLFLFYCKYFTF